MLSYNAMWCNFNSANGFDTDDTSTFFYMLRNVQVGGFYLKSDFGGSEIEYEGGLHVSGGIGSNGLASRQYQPIPSPNLNFVRNCTLMHFGKGGSEDLQSFGPCPNSSSAIQFSDTRIYNPSGKTTVCKLPLEYWQAQGTLKSVTVEVLPTSADEIVGVARNVLGV